jgi:hypothetical protein
MNVDNTSGENWTCVKCIYKHLHVAANWPYFRSRCTCQRWTLCHISCHRKVTVSGQKSPGWEPNEGMQYVLGSLGAACLRNLLSKETISECMQIVYYVFIKYAVFHQQTCRTSESAQQGRSKQHQYAKPTRLPSVRDNPFDLKIPKNPRYLGGRDQEDGDLKPALG